MKWRGGEDALHHQDTQEAGHQIPKAGEAAQQGEDASKDDDDLGDPGVQEVRLDPPTSQEMDVHQQEVLEHLLVNGDDHQGDQADRDEQPLGEIFQQSSQQIPTGPPWLISYQLPVGG